MSPGLTLVIVSLTLFQVKHLICDYVLQTPYMYLNKGKYFHPGGIFHAGIHAVGSILPVLVLGREPILIAALLGIEFVVHYHVDWLKEQINKRRGLTHAHALFWAIFGADQFLHQMTYVVMIAYLAREAGL
jgi:uncharacterized protein DUF3307